MLAKAQARRAARARARKPARGTAHAQARVGRARAREGGALRASAADEAERRGVDRLGRLSRALCATARWLRRRRALGRRGRRLKRARVTDDALAVHRRVGRAFHLNGARRSRDLRPTSPPPRLVSTALSRAPHAAARLDSIALATSLVLDLAPLPVVTRRLSCGLAAVGMRAVPPLRWLGIPGGPMVPPLTS